MFRRYGLLLVLLAAFVVGAASARSDELSDAGKKLLDKWQNSILVVQITAKSQMGGDEGGAPHENKNEGTAVIIDQSGLAVMSLSETTPQAMMEQMMPDGSEAGPKFTSEITDMKVLGKDGKQIPYKVVLRDKDLDLAFIRPVQTPATPFTAMDLAKASKPAVLEQVIQLDRMPAVAGHTLGAVAGRVNAIIQKPRMCYVSGLNGLGAPVFTIDGNLVGIVVIRGGQSGGGGGGPSMIRIILPAADVLEAANQAPKTVQ